VMVKEEEVTRGDNTQACGHNMIDKRRAQINPGSSPHQRDRGTTSHIGHPKGSDASAVTLAYPQNILAPRWCPRGAH
jgi:hypothetical protein